VPHILHQLGWGGKCHGGRLVQVAIQMAIIDRAKSGINAVYKKSQHLIKDDAVMAVHLKPKNAQELLTIDGVQLFVGQAGIKKPDYNDVTLMVLSPNSRVAGVFTQNRYCAAPVRVCQELLPSNLETRACGVRCGG